MTKPFKVSEYLDTPEDVVAYLEEALADGDPRLLKLAVRYVLESSVLSDDQMTTNPDELTILKYPKYKSQWTLDKEWFLVFSCTRPMPSRWIRFWQQHILGIYWREYRD